MLLHLPQVRWLTSLLRIAALLDSVTDDQKAAAMVTGSPVGEHVFGNNDYPVPLIDEQSVRRYVNQINTAPW